MNVRGAQLVSMHNKYDVQRQSKNQRWRIKRAGKTFREKEQIKTENSPRYKNAMIVKQLDFYNSFNAISDFRV